MGNHMCRHIESFSQGVCLGSRNFTKRGRLISRYRIVLKRPLAFNVSCIFLLHAQNND